jgi:hypothetical protein
MRLLVGTLDRPPAPCYGHLMLEASDVVLGDGLATGGMRS